MQHQFLKQCGIIRSDAAASTLTINGLYGALGFAAPIIFFLLLTPILVSRMGDAQYGLWNVGIALLGVAGVTQFGLGTAISKFIAEYHANDDDEGLSVAVTTGWFMYLVLGVVFTIPLYLLSPYLGRALASSKIAPDQVAETMRIASFGFLPSLLINAGLSIPIGFQRFGIPMMINVGRGILTLIMAFAIVSLGGSVKVITLSTVLVLWGLGIVSLCIAVRMVRRKDFHARFSTVQLRRMLSLMAYMGFANLGSQIFASLDRIVVGAVLGVSSVTYYSVSIGVANRLLALAGAATRTLMPAASLWSSRQEFQRLRHYLWSSIKLLIILNIILGGGLVILSKPILTFWMGQEFAREVSSTFRILVIIYVVISLNTPAFHIGNGIGAPKAAAISTLVGGMLTIVLIVILGDLFGLQGAAIANVGYLTTLFIIPYVARKLQ